MFAQQGQKIELMIVCDDKTRQYGNYLIQLIGQNDDVEGKDVGTKDGEVVAAIYTEKQHLDSQAKITSNTHILFVGNSKIAKEQGKFITCKFNKYGMHYGWQGKRAVMYVDPETLKKDDYNKFIDFAKGYQLDYQKKKLNAINALPEPLKWVGVMLPVVYPVAIYGLITGKVKKQIKEQQYQCLALALYMDDLQHFIEG